jgi:hypothetical protein
MRKSIASAIVLALSSLACSAPSHAATTYVTGTISGLYVYSNVINAAETVLFVLSVGPITTGCSNGSGSGNPTFSFDPADVSDAQSRKNMLAMLYAARTSGLPISVSYDNAGAHCDTQFGFAIPLVISM